MVLKLRVILMMLKLSRKTRNIMFYYRWRIGLTIFIGICTVGYYFRREEFPYPLLQSNEEVDFPTENGGFPRIPHIVHQIYDDEYLPEIFSSNVKSFVNNNPSWEYQFWTYDSGLGFLTKHCPYLVDIYKAFGNDVKKADLLRFAVLYEYGGFYSDLDVDNLRPLDRLTMKYACIIPVEPFENSMLLHGKQFLLSTAVMLCRPKHPFFKQLLTDLQYADPNGYPVRETGPWYVTSQFCRYYNVNITLAKAKLDLSSNSPNFYKGTLKEDDNDAVYIPNSQYLMDNLNPINLGKDGKFTKLCSNTTGQLVMFKQACMELKIRRTVRENKKFTFTVHHWFHLWEKNKEDKDKMEKIHILKLVPNCKLYSNVTGT